MVGVEAAAPPSPSAHLALQAAASRRPLAARPITKASQRCSISHHVHAHGKRPSDRGRSAILRGSPSRASRARTRHVTRRKRPRYARSGSSVKSENKSRARSPTRPKHTSASPRAFSLPPSPASQCTMALRRASLMCTSKGAHRSHALHGNDAVAARPAHVREQRRAPLTCTARE